MPQSDFSRGEKAGQIDAILSEHTKHLTKINGSVERFALATEALAQEIRLIREESRLDRERVKVAADTLATETERRRKELEGAASTGDRKFTRTQVVVTLLVTIGLAFIGFYLASKGGT